MKRKSLAVKRKVEKKNSKIKKIYPKFKSIIFKNIKKDIFAVAVSGGPDSLCLAYLSKLYQNKFKNEIHFIIIDHKLRKESAKEALKVKRILNLKKIKSKILQWKGKVPKSNIQKNARDIRYSLLSEYCLKNNIKFLLTGHHLDDQIENFFIRLIRGSGLSGLSSMSEISKYSTKLKIIRPLLSFKKRDLKILTLNFFKNYIKDPSNKNESFLRVRVRNYRSEMEKEGLDTNKIIKTINNLLSANKAINFYKNKALNKHVSFLSPHKCVINRNIFLNESGEIIFKSFTDILSSVSGTYYPPRSKKVVNLINRIKKNNFKTSTLGGCLIEKKNNIISISKENKTKKSL